MALTRPGCVYLSCRASLEQPRPVSGDSDTVVFDALLFCAKAVDKSSVIGASLRCSKEEDDNTVLGEGIFDLFAIVVAYRPHVNEPSADFPQDIFKLMVDIVQLNPVPVEPKDVTTACGTPARVVGVGIVTSVDTVHHSFTLTPAQYVTGGAEEEQIPVRAMMEKGSKWPDPVKRLPSAHGFVSFSGKLYHFDENSLAQIPNVNTRAVINLDTITYLLRPTYSPSSVASSVLPSQVEDADSIALKKRVEKYSGAGKKGKEKAT